MPIRVRIPFTATDRVTFVLSPFLETLWSLHVLREPEHHRLHHAWVRIVRAKTAELRHDLVAFGFAYRGAPTACGIPLGGVAIGSFADELARSRAVTPAEALRFFTRSFHEGTEPMTDGTSPSAAVAERFLAYATRIRASVPLAERALREPRSVLVELADLMERYWQVAFAERWDHSLPLLKDEIEGARRRIAGDLRGLLRMLPSDVRIDDDGLGFVVDRPHDHAVSIGPVGRLVLTPSYFVAPHVRVSCERPGIVAIAYPPERELARAASIPPPRPLLALMRVLADDTRLRLVRFLATRGPRSTQELAGFIGVSEPTISGHLRKLEEVGLVSSKRDGPYVLYELRVDPLGRIDAELGSYLRPQRLPPG